MIKFLYIFAALLGLWVIIDIGLLNEDAGSDAYSLPPAPENLLGVSEKERPKIDDTPPAYPDVEVTTALDFKAKEPIIKTADATPRARQVCPTPQAGSPSTITHFGQPIRLNGANLAWSRDAHYARDVGTDYVDMRAFRERFAKIAAAGGNSARWWMHTNGTVTPHIEASGKVIGLSAQRTNQQVIDQVRAILDAAWAEGILLNITLFSFDFMCQQDRLGAHEAMLNQHSQSYLDNALAPLVHGLKDHPALFAWEIFNESEGMAVGSSFFGDPNLQNCAVGRAQPTRIFQRFVNHAAARIHAIDPNVKVTTSVGHPHHLKDYTNRLLAGQAFSRPGGVLDFYQIHWYSEDFNPFLKTAGSYRFDRPIVVGEYEASGEQNARRLLKNGYAGAWMWSQTSENDAKVSLTIQSGKVCAPPIHKAAIEACIRNKPSWCYK